MARFVWASIVLVCVVALKASAEEQFQRPKLANDYANRPAEDQPAAANLQPSLLAEQPAPSVYELPTPPTGKEAINYGGIHLDMKVSYFSNYLFRGVNRSEFISEASQQGSSSQANFQFDGKLSFDLGNKLPHPFIGIFANVLDSDPVSNFQEVRPFFGVDWNIRPLIFSVGNTLYEFPDRKELNTSEVWLKVTLDDAAILKRDEPLLSPYFFAAYDYDRYEGWYLETGISHDFVIEKTGITLTPLANIAYVVNNGAFKQTPNGEDTGFQHYEVGIIGRYSLNTLFNVSQRYGNWSLNGYLYYDAGIDSELLSTTTVWGGMGIELTY